MQVRHDKEVANHLDPESCVGRREAGIEALTGETTGRPLSSEIRKSGMPTLYRQAECKTTRTDIREVYGDPARSNLYHDFSPE